MKRIDVLYHGERYSIGNRDLAAVEAEIEDAVAAGTPQWLDVNYGDAAVRPARLLLTASTSIALIPIEG